MPRTCSLCGRTGDAPEDGLPEGWSFSVENGRTNYQCGECVRANIRSIEAKLSEDWWE